MSANKFRGKRGYSLVLLMLGLLLVLNYMKSTRPNNTATGQHQHAVISTDLRRRSMETSVIAHAPGFTLFENAYWRNYTWYFVTARPWAFPDLPMVMTNAPDYGQTTTAMFHNGLAKVILPTEAEDLDLDLEEVETVQGTTFFFNDKIYLKHYYHLVGEMFLGSWRVYTSVLVNPFNKRPQKTLQANTKSTLDQLPPIERFIFGYAPPQEMYDRAGMNEYFFDRVFPQVPLEFEESWQARADSLKLFRFDLVVIADRWSGHMKRTSKPMDYAFRLPAPSNWVSDLKDRMLANYQGPVSLKDPSHINSKPVITYLSRQEAHHRTMNPATHEDLIVGLKALEEEGLAEVNIESFTGKDPKDEQAAKLSRTTIFVSLHGNGLTNLIWMTPDAYGRSAVYEIQQPGMYTDDYAIISEALGIDHWIIGGRDLEREYCQRPNCGIYGTTRGVDAGSHNYTFRVPELVNRLRDRLTQNDHRTWSTQIKLPEVL